MSETALQWTQSIGGAKNLDLHLVISDPSAKTWSLPRSTGMSGQNSWMADMGQGTLAAVRAVGDTDALSPGVYVAASYDKGNSWDIEGQVRVWGTNDHTDITSHEKNQPVTPHRVAFGQVNAIALPLGDLLVTWRCVEGEFTCIRFARFRLIS